MIIDYTCTFKDYPKIQKKAWGDKPVNWDYKCPYSKCGAQGQMHYHSSYDRYIIVLEEDGLKEYPFRVIRLICESCGKTNAVLCADAIPFWQITVQAVFFLLMMLFDDDQTYHPVRASRITGISRQLLSRYLQILREYYERLVLLFRSTTLWQEKENPTLQIAIVIARSGAPPFPQKDFFTQNQSPLFLHRRSTVSYPLRIGGA